MSFIEGWIVEMKEEYIIKRIFVFFFLINIIFFVFLNYIDDNVRIYDYIIILLFTLDFLWIGGYVLFVVYRVFLCYDYFSMRSYHSDLGIKICNDYINLNNINDVFRYELKEIEKNRYVIVIAHQLAKGSTYVTWWINRAEYQVNLYEDENGTEITCMFIKSCHSKKPVYPWYIDRLIENKFNATLNNTLYYIEKGEK